MSAAMSATNQSERRRDCPDAGIPCRGRAGCWRRGVEVVAHGQNRVRRRRAPRSGVPICVTRGPDVGDAAVPGPVVAEVREADGRLVGGTAPRGERGRVVGRSRAQIQPTIGNRTSDLGPQRAGLSVLGTGAWSDVSPQLGESPTLRHGQVAEQLPSGVVAAPGGEHAIEPPGPSPPGAQRAHVYVTR
jgi:hypothetical protein